ncbi:tubby C-terminal domain-like protein [Bacillus cereus]
MISTELVKTYLEIDKDSPIQDRAFFICLFQCGGTPSPSS